jgi:hypothetical protein
LYDEINRREKKEDKNKNDNHKFETVRAPSERMIGLRAGVCAERKKKRYIPRSAFCFPLFEGGKTRIFTPKIKLGDDTNAMYEERLPRNKEKRLQKKCWEVE